MRDEIMKILKMVESGNVGAAQAAELMDAMGVFDMRLPTAAHGGEARQLCIYVDSSSGDEVRVRVPAAMIKAGIGVARGINVGGQAALRDIDMEAVMEAVDQLLDAGGTGELVTVHSGEGDRVVIRLESFTQKSPTIRTLPGTQSVVEGEGGDSNDEASG